MIPPDDTSSPWFRNYRVALHSLTPDETAAFLAFTRTLGPDTDWWDPPDFARRRAWFNTNAERVWWMVVGAGASTDIDDMTRGEIQRIRRGRPFGWGVFLWTPVGLADRYWLSRSANEGFWTVKAA